MDNTIVSCEKIVKSYPVPGAAPLLVLDSIDWSMARGSFVSIIGESGCGKSTLMNIIGLLDTQTSGRLVIDSVVFESKRDNGALSAYRAKKIGFIFQQHHLLPELCALDNVIFAQLIRGRNKTDARKDAEDILRKLFTKDELSSGVLHRHPATMSGGQCQRVAIARALVGNPPLVLADEPTGNLDEKSANEVFEMFLALQKAMGVSLIMVTHNPSQATRADMSFVLKNKHLQRQCQ